MKIDVVELDKIRPVLMAKVQQMDAEHLDRLHRIIVKLEVIEAADELHTMADAAGGTDDLDEVNAIVREFRERRPYRA